MKRIATAGRLGLVMAAAVLGGCVQNLFFTRTRKSTPYRRKPVWQPMT